MKFLIDDSLFINGVKFLSELKFHQLVYEDISALHILVSVRWWSSSSNVMSRRTSVPEVSDDDYCENVF